MMRKSKSKEMAKSASADLGTGSGPSSALPKSASGDAMSAAAAAAASPADDGSSRPESPRGSDRAVSPAAAAAAATLSPSSGHRKPAYKTVSKAGAVQDEVTLAGGAVLPTPDGSVLYTKTWAAQGPQVAVVFLVHGIGEHINRYDHVAAYFNQRGFKVVGFDQRGHGRTPGTRGDAGKYEKTMSDIETVIAANFDRGYPHFLFGHSLGGMHVLNFISRRAEDRDQSYPLVGVIASAPAVAPAVAPPPVKLAVGNMLKSIPVVNTVTVTTELSLESICRDPETIQKYVNDPYVHSNVSLRSAPDYIAAGTYLLKEGFKTFNKPVLIAHGDADRLTSQPHSRQFYELLSVTDKKYRLWPGFYHELHNEPEREEVLAEYVEWLVAHVPAQPAPVVSAVL